MKVIIYQMNDYARDERIGFMPYDWVVKEGFDLVKDFDKLYNKVYEYDHTKPFHTIGELLEKIFFIFNMEHPKDFRGHSLSTSDVVEIEGVKYYCDSFGWKKLN